MRSVLVFDCTHEDFDESDVADSLSIQFGLSDVYGVFCDTGLDVSLIDECISARLIGFIACSELELSKVWVVDGIEGVDEDELRAHFDSLYLGAIAFDEQVRKALLIRAKVFARKRWIFRNRSLIEEMENKERDLLVSLGFDEFELNSRKEMQRKNHENEVAWQVSCVTRWTEEFVTCRPLFGAACRYRVD